MELIWRQRASSSKSKIVGEGVWAVRPEDEPEDVLFKSIYGVRTIELNRPKKLHSLNGSMVRKILPRIREWEKSQLANVIVIKGSGPKALCAGGDVAALAKDISENGADAQQRAADFFGLEYQLDHVIATCTKPYVAFMDGITMGGGVGLSVHAPFRIATERTVFAMPETTIGFFPDVGASFFLPRMAGATGTYLALTSDKLNGVNVFYAGVATHYIHSTSLPALEARLAELRFNDYDDILTRCRLIDATIEEFCTGLPHDQPIHLAGELRQAIDRCFSLDTVDEIIAALKAETGSTKDWAEKTIKTLHQRSPTSVHVALRQMRLGRNWSIRETFQREHLIATKFMKHPDFAEGVSSLLLRKPRTEPQWQPASLEDIKPEDKVAEPFFKVEGENRLSLLSDGDFKEYNYTEFNLPKEADIARLVRTGEHSKKAVVEHFVAARKGKQGVKEVVEEVLKRNTRSDGGKAMWIDA